MVEVLARGPARPASDTFGLQQHYIDGRYRPSASGDTFDVLDPTTNERLAVTASGGAEDIAAAVVAARQAFDQGPWPRLKAAERAAVLRNIAEAIRRHADELIVREVAQIGMPIAQMKHLEARAGGVKDSGIGREGGDYAFDFYCETEIVRVALGSHPIPRLGLPE